MVGVSFLVDLYHPDRRWLDFKRDRPYESSVVITDKPVFPFDNEEQALFYVNAYRRILPAHSITLYEFNPETAPVLREID